MVKTKKITHQALRQAKHNTWQENPSSVSSIGPKLLNASRWRTKGQSISPAEPMRTKNLHKVSADLCLHSQASHASTLTRMLRLVFVLNERTILGSQPKMLWILLESFGQSLSASVAQQRNSLCKSAFSYSDKLNSEHDHHTRRSFITKP